MLFLSRRLPSRLFRARVAGFAGRGRSGPEGTSPQSSKEFALPAKRQVGGEFDWESPKAPRTGPGAMFESACRSNHLRRFRCLAPLRKWREPGEGQTTWLSPVVPAESGSARDRRIVQVDAARTGDPATAGRRRACDPSSTNCDRRTYRAKCRATSRHRMEVRSFVSHA